MRLKTLAIPLALAALAGCAPYSIRYDYDSHAPYAGYKTFDWYAKSAKANGKSDGVQNPIMDRRVRGAVERELAAKGLRMEKTGEPDVLITYYPVYRQGTVYTTTTVGPHYGWWRPWGYGVGASFTEARTFREGSIILEIVDNKTNQLVWQAVAEGALTGLDDPEDAEHQVGKAVHEMLSRFPPPAH
ncbi:DUF4136 domain-containing protein [Mesoterricola sediminis]|uniref:DUF4136 domain-containing protein n=1 Tax=Mesoterricola sediminis TaxID=2927980 RepID=A0AA48KDC1_9BACT|nr:DUF4136 domain-containing protein [Mesoterricola sediminis]BDU76162.1 hypothetical protein METESE_11200 [Mesoterricola sediminis]